jgi:GntR family transcriptional regulator/MocR family aminotransferase
VIVTNGAQGAFDLVAHVLLEPGALVAVEEPGYPPPRLLFESYGARVAAVPVDAAGLDVGRLPEGVRLIDRRGRVVYVGSFSKSLLPAVRLGYLVAPPSLQRALQAASYVAGWFAQWPAQAALASLIESGLLARHVRKMRRAYAARQERILRTLERDFAEWMVPVPSVTGLHLAARMRSRDVRLEAKVADGARRVGVRFDRLSAYCASAAPQTGIVLGYGAIPEAKIEEGLRRLRRCFAAAV